MLDTSATILEQSRTIAEGMRNVSKAVWCDQGGHAFSERDPGRRHFSETSFDSEGEPDGTYVFDVCGKCGAKMAEARKALTNAAEE